MRSSSTTLLLAAIALGAPLFATAGGDAAKGAGTFIEECGDCHSLTPGKNKKGPSLHGVVGRPAGSVADFSGYSDAMKQAGFAWSAERMDAYIMQPRKVVPGGRMKYDGLADAQARADIVSYLASMK